MLKKFEIINNCITVSDKTTSPILVYINPDMTEKEFLIKNYNLDEHTLNSALDPDEIARLEFEADHMALIFKRPRNYSSQEQFLFKVNSVGLFVFKEFLIIVAPEECALFEGKLFQKVNSLMDIVLKLINRTIYHFLEHLKIINMISSEIEQKVNSSMENKYLIHMFTLEKSLVYYLNSINANATVIEKLKNSASKIGFSTESQELLEDLVIETNQCYKQAEIYSNILSSLMDARASIVNNNLNVLMKTLTKITLCVMVPTFVVSAFSMNVSIPFDNNPWAFLIVLSLSLLSLITLMLFFKHKKW